MAIRTAVDIPKPIHDELRRRSENSGASINSLVVRAIEQTYAEPRNGRYVTGPLIRNTGKRGPLYPTDENPHDLITDN
jgi:hypothetical protein